MTGRLFVLKVETDNCVRDCTRFPLIYNFMFSMLVVPSHTPTRWYHTLVLREFGAMTDSFVSDEFSIAKCGKPLTTANQYGAPSAESFVAIIPFVTTVSKPPSKLFAFTHALNDIAPVISRLLASLTLA